MYNMKGTENVLLPQRLKSSGLFLLGTEDAFLLTSKAFTVVLTSLRST